MILGLSNGFTNRAGCLIALRSGRDALRRVLGLDILSSLFQSPGGRTRDVAEAPLDAQDAAKRFPPDQAKLGPTVRPGPGAKAETQRPIPLTDSQDPQNLPQQRPTLVPALNPSSGPGRVRLGAR